MNTLTILVVIAVFIMLIIYPGLGLIWNPIKTIFMWVVCRKKKKYNVDYYMGGLVGHSYYTWERRTKEDKKINW